MGYIEDEKAAQVGEPSHVRREQVVDQDQPTATMGEHGKYVDQTLPKKSRFWKIQSKGAPGSESRTDTRLVSPAVGCEKENLDTLRTGSWNINLSTAGHIAILYIYPDGPHSCTVQKQTQKH